MKLNLLFVVFCVPFFYNFPQLNENRIFIASYNLENLFDEFDDPLKNDEDFLPTGKNEWTTERITVKFKKLGRAIRSMNDGLGPDILGVVESENREILERMLASSLGDMKYKTAYCESPDTRGIDVGLAFKSDRFQLLGAKGEVVILPDDRPTRLILSASLLFENRDTLIIFVNHWPSRIGGERNSEPQRIAAASVLRKLIDSCNILNPNSKIIIMGDFNDEPENVSIIDVLGAKPLDSLNARLLNLSYYEYKNGLGSYKYQNTWNMLDQIIISSSLINGESIRYKRNSFKVYNPRFLQTYKGKYEGAPFPTFRGGIYLGGYSDHYPVVMILEAF